MKKLLLFATAFGLSMGANASVQPGWFSSVGHPVSVLEAQDGDGEAETPTIITETPEGTETLWARNSSGYSISSSGQAKDAADYGEAVRMVVAPDGTTVYLNNPFSTRDCPGWMKGTIDAEGNITMTFPQCVYQLNGDYYYAVCLESNATTNTVTPTANQEFKLLKTDTGYICTELKKILGLCELIDYSAGDTELEGKWTGIGIYGYTMTEQKTKPVEIPADLVVEEWAMIDGFFAGWTVNVGFTADKVYIQGLCETAPEYWVVADFDGTNAVFKESYIGVSSTRHMAYLHPAKGTFDSPTGAPVKTLTMENTATLTFDKEKNMLWAPVEWEVLKYQGDCPVGFFMNDAAAGFIIDSTPSGESKTYTIQHTVAPRFNPQHRDATVPPMQPIITRVGEYLVETGEGSLRYIIPNIDVEYNVIDPEKMYYNLLVNGEPYTFEQADYTFFPRDYTDIPLNFTDGWMITDKGYFKLLYYKFRDWDTLGLQSFFKDGDEEVRSEAVIYPYDPNVSVETLEAADSVSAEYFDLAGRRISNPEKGMYVRVSKMADGTRKSDKVVF